MRLLLLTFLVGCQKKPPVSVFKVALSPPVEFDLEAAAPEGVNACVARPLPSGDSPEAREERAAIACEGWVVPHSLLHTARFKEEQAEDLFESYLQERRGRLEDRAHAEAIAASLRESENAALKELRVTKAVAPALVVSSVVLTALAVFASYELAQESITFR